MNRRDYRAAFDAVDFSADFEERTLQKLAAVRQASEKEQIIMPMNRVKKTALLNDIAHVPPQLHFVVNTYTEQSPLPVAGLTAGVSLIYYGR